MSTSHYTAQRDTKGRIPVPDSATKPFPRVHSRSRPRKPDESSEKIVEVKRHAVKEKGHTGNEKGHVVNEKGRGVQNSHSDDDKRHSDHDKKHSDDDRRHSDNNKHPAKGIVKANKSKTVKTKGAAPKKRSSSSSSSSSSSRSSSSSSGSDGRSRRIRKRSPIECQCSCHKEGGRRRSPSREARKRGKSNSADRRSSLDSIHGRFGKSAFSEGSDSRTNSGKSTDDGHNRNGSRSRGGSDEDEEDDRRNRMPPININDRDANKKGKGGFTKNSKDPASKYKPRVDSKTSHLSVTSVNSKGGGGKNSKEPFRYYGRSHSAGSITSFGGTPSQYDYAHEDFLTPRFTSEYQARYDMRHGQRYKVQPDKSIHYIDPAGEHILVPKGDGKQLMPRRNSDSDIAKNNKNVRLEPLNAKRPPNPNQGGTKTWVGNSTSVEQGAPRARPGPEGRVVAPTGGGPPKRASVHSLPPMQRTPSMPQASDTRKATSAREETVHPLGLSSPPKRRSQLQPL